MSATGRHKQILLTAFAFFALALPRIAHAHLLWFVDEPARAAHLPPLFFWVAGVVVFGLVLALRPLAVRAVGGTVVQVLHLQTMPFIGLARNLLLFALGAALIIFSLQGKLFSPDIAVVTNLDHLIQAFALLAGLGFLSIVLRRYAAALLLAALVLLWIGHGAFAFFVHAEYAGLALAFLLAYQQRRFSLQRAMRYARIGLGTALIIAAFQEKLLEPGYGIAFLEMHHWNVLAAVGLPVSDLAFVAIAGTAEVFFGLLLLLNIFPRFVGLALLGLFLTTAALLGPAEVLGHLVSGMIAISLVLYGTDTFHFTEEQEIEL
jgi:hypothetical protein